ncbi:MAG: hypothetical protein WCB46_06040 [Methanoregula sp.]
MPPGEHVHIISAGEKIQIAYLPYSVNFPPSRMLTSLPTARSIALSSNPEIEKERIAVRHAVDAVKEISCSLSIPFDRKTVFAPVYPSVRTILTEIHCRHPKPGSRSTCRGGSKPLWMALFAFAHWLGGAVYSASDEVALRNIPLPEQSVRSMMENPNYQTILAILIRNRKTSEGTSDVSWVSRQYLYQQVWPYYTRSRARSPGPRIPISRSSATGGGANLPRTCRRQRSHHSHGKSPESRMH